MKKVITLVLVVFYASIIFAQDSKMQEAPVKHMESKESKVVDKTEQAPVRNAPMKMKHECYMMKDGALMHCMGDNSTPQKAEVKLRNGATISADGVMTTQDGQSTKLQNGQCVLMNGVLGDCEKMHAPMHPSMPGKADPGQKK